MLKISKTNRTTVPATINIRDEAGGIVPVGIKLTGVVRAQPEWDELFKRHAASEAASVTEVFKANAGLYAEVFDGWEGVADDDDKPLPYSAEVVEVLLLGSHGPAANAGLMQAVHELRYGAVTKN